MKSIKIIIILGQVLFLFLYNLYCFTNKTNHTGVDFILIANLSLIFGVALLLTTILKPNLVGKADKLALIIFSISILTGLNIYIFDHFNIMVQYEKWLNGKTNARQTFLDKLLDLNNLDSMTYFCGGGKNNHAYTPFLVEQGGKKHS